MASIYQRTNKDGSKVWRAVIRLNGHPSVSKCFDRKQEAEDWSNETESHIKRGKYSNNQSKQKKTIAELIDLYIQDAVIGHHKAAKDTIHQLNYFKERIGDYALMYITPELLLQERKRLAHMPTNKGVLRNPSTINRYFATLGGAFRYACKNLRWTDENPCGNLLQLKVSPKERRILVGDEENRLLEACRQSLNPFLYCIVLIAMTTGARKSEILNLTWNSIDFENGLAHIKDSKNGRPRCVGLVKSVVQELKRLYNMRDPAKTKIFASKTLFGTLDIKKSWNSALCRAGIDNFVFHGLRHHFCSIGGKLGASGQQLRSQLGHVTASMTDHYSHLDAQATRFIGESIEERFLGRTTNAKL